MPNERACTRHPHDGYEAEMYERLGTTYIMLRCPICHRPNGGRLVRKTEARHPNNRPTTNEAAWLRLLKAALDD